MSPQWRYGEISGRVQVFCLPCPYSSGCWVKPGAWCECRLEQAETIETLKRDER